MKQTVATRKEAYLFSEQLKTATQFEICVWSYKKAMARECFEFCWEASNSVGYALQLSPYSEIQTDREVLLSREQNYKHYRAIIESLYHIYMLNPSY